MMRMAKAVSGLLRPSWARLLAAVAMATAARVQLAWLWMSVMGTGSDLAGIPAVVWCLAVVVASIFAVIDESDAAASAERRWVTGKAPFILWGCLTRDGRVAVWMALLWILLWPAELLACLWVALWWLCAALAAAMDFTVCRRKGTLEGKR